MTLVQHSLNGKVKPLISLPDSAYYGIAPDMGAFEWMPNDSLNIEDLPIPTEYTLHPIQIHLIPLPQSPTVYQNQKM